MATGRPRLLALCLAALAPIGCAGQNPFTSRQATVGSLKASVSQLEFENEKLRKDVGELKTENARLDNDLIQERSANGEITARLDDAKDLLRRQAGNSSTLGGASSSFEEDVPPPVTIPKARRVRTGRPSPPASIRNPDSTRESDDLSLQWPSKTPRDIGPDDSGADDRWLPIARGLPSSIKVRQ